MKEISVIIPAYNEVDAIASVVGEVRTVLQQHFSAFEIIVVDDGSIDGTDEVIRTLPVRMIKNVHNAGYGFSLVRGIRAARFEAVAIIDGDGSYPAHMLPVLYDAWSIGFDMIVGARQGNHYWGSPLRSGARFIFKTLAEYVAGRSIADINSGLRIMRRSRILPFLRETCRTFSFTTSLTLILMLNGYFVEYLPIPYHKRTGHSKVRFVRDTLRTGQIMVEIIARYNPVKLFLLLAFFVILCALVPLITFLYTGSAVYLATFFIGCFFALVIFSWGLVAVSLKDATHT